jgi:PadR family transcriptional regulator PadR
MSIQVAGALLEGCVLSLLSKEDEYGYSLTQRVKNDLGVSESTLYPVMRRLQTDDCLTAYDVPFSGRNRRYYRITERGREKYEGCKREWQLFKERIDGILTGGRMQ